MAKKKKASKYELAKLAQQAAKERALRLKWQGGVDDTRKDPRRRAKLAYDVSKAYPTGDPFAFLGVHGANTPVDHDKLTCTFCKVEVSPFEATHGKISRKRVEPGYVDSEHGINNADTFYFSQIKVTACPACVNEIRPSKNGKDLTAVHMVSREDC